MVVYGGATVGLANKDTVLYDGCFVAFTTAVRNTMYFYNTGLFFITITGLCT